MGQVPHTSYLKPWEPRQRICPKSHSAIQTPGLLVAVGSQLHYKSSAPQSLQVPLFCRKYSYFM